MRGLALPQNREFRRNHSGSSGLHFSRRQPGRWKNFAAYPIPRFASVARWKLGTAGCTSRTGSMIPVQNRPGAALAQRLGRHGHMLMRRRSGCDQFDRVADFDAAGPGDSCVQTELPAEPAYDITQNFRIFLGRVRIIGRHDTAAAKVSETDLRFGQPQNRARPRAQ